MADEAKKHGQSVVNISVPFETTMPNDNKFKKALKFPTSLFSQSMLDIVAKSKLLKGRETDCDTDKHDIPNDDGDVFSTACSDSDENAEESNTELTIATQADLAVDELQSSSLLHEDHLQSVKAVYLSLTCDLPTLRISGM